MRNFFNVLKFEYTGMVRGKGFLITVALFMSLLLVVASLPMILGFFNRGGDEEIYYDATGEQAVGVFYDTTGWYTPEIIASFSPHFDWTPIDRPDAIERGLETGDFAIGLRLAADGITVYIPGSDWMGAGNFMFYEMARAMAQAQALEQAGVDAAVIETALATDPTMDVVVVGRDGGQSYFVAMAFTILLMLMVSMYGAIVSHSVSTEKTSKAIELLTISTSSNSLIFGKVIGVGLVALTQFGIALIPGVLVMYFNLERWHEFAPMVGGIMEMIFASNILGMAFLFFLLAFFTYAFLFAALSSTVSRAEDLSSSQSIPTVLLMAAYFVSFSALFAPDAFHAQVLSYVPFFSPLVMMARATMTEVPVLEIALSAGVSLLYVLLLGFLSAKIFRIGIMLTGNRPNLRQIFKLMRQA
ncbi:MAG: ABC transporter permease [Oscillospiraceae bacterium]|nr:ABC transporter permease [Oscillospiraceae bacterium]